MGGITSSVTSGMTVSGFPAYFCRAWVSFNGTGVVAIRSSGNVSSITDNGVGDYTLNFATPLADANYTYQGTCSKVTANVSGSNVVQYDNVSARTSSAFRFQIKNTSSGTLEDVNNIDISVIR